MSAAPRVLKVAVPAPLYRTFDYLAPAKPVAIGARVRVPFGKQQLAGIVLGAGAESELPRQKLKPILEVLDQEPLLSEQLLKLLVWAADYYHHPIGEVIATAMPVWLRQGRSANVDGVRIHSLTPAGCAADPAQLARAPAQRKVLAALAVAPDGLGAEALADVSPSWSSAIKALVARGWVKIEIRDCLEAANAPDPLMTRRNLPAGHPSATAPRAALPPVSTQSWPAAPASIPSAMSETSRGTASTRSPADVQDARTPRRPGMAESSLDPIGEGENAAPAPILNPAQQAAVDTAAAAFGTYRCYLLHGVTGSGKTEVYLRLIERVLARGEQVLVLVPEIGLTPQLIGRFTARLRAPIAVLHSGLTDQQRLCAWLMARSGRAPIVLGTRSAVFTPLQRPGLIVVDEEHDASYKQQEGFRYSARDLAVLRASREGVPVVLGSATPSLESLKNARDGAYRLLELPDRTGGAGMPAVQLLDMRRLKPDEGLSHPLRAAIAERLARSEQSLLFLNRRGFAPVWMCHDCGWIAPCLRCDARLTFHQGSRKLRCHHCGAEQPLPQRCPKCGGENLHPLGEGTERIEAALMKYFPHARIERIDRDSTRRKGTLEEKLRRAHEGDADILIGTQMLSKGHDFPNVTLVGVLNADQGLYSLDFHAAERLFQQIVQVAGRAGRADKPGQVLIQTWHPEHPLFAALVNHDFSGFADYALTERREAEFPPFSFLALLRAESSNAQAALAFLREARSLAAAGQAGPPVQVFDPMPAQMERRAGRYRAQMLIQAPKRPVLQQFLRDWVPRVAELPAGKRVRWSLDVDPADTY